MGVCLKEYPGPLWGGAALKMAAMVCVRLQSRWMIVL